jgi:sensor histidine kinase regulating citrate/malate metabolism
MNGGESPDAGMKPPEYVSFEQGSTFESAAAFLPIIDSDRQ